MDANDIMTGKLPVTGDGFHKTYEESIIRLSRNLDFGLAYNNSLFINKETGAILWGTDKEGYEKYLNNGKYKRVVLINTLYIGNDRAFIEVIELEILKIHLMDEREQLRMSLENNNQLSLEKIKGN